MTIKKIVAVTDGRLHEVPSELDADLLEVSSEVGNVLQVKEDGLYVPNQSLPVIYNSLGLVLGIPKILTTQVVADSNGDWTVDYSHVGFTQIPTVVTTGVSVGTALADKRFSSISPEGASLTKCSGKLLSSSSAGLLAAMTMVSAAGTVNILVIGV